MIVDLLEELPGIRQLQLILRPHSVPLDEDTVRVIELRSGQ